MKNRVLINLFVVSFIVLGVPVIAFSNMRIDHALWPQHAQKLIVAGEIQKVKDTQIMDGPVIEEFDFKIDQVILGDPSLKSKDIKTIFSGPWPDILVPFNKGSFFILIAQSTTNQEGVYYSFTIVPTQNRKFTPVHNYDEAKRMLTKELLAELNNEKSSDRQRELILLAAPILNYQEAENVIPFLESKNIWLKRAALAALLYITEDKKYLLMAEEDIRQFIETTKPTDLIKGFKEGYSYDPYSLLFQHYFFLDRVDWASEEDLKNATFLPLFRLIAHNSNVSESIKWFQGYRSICRLGTEEDLMSLYEYYQSERNGERKQILDNDYYRQDLIMGMSRILKLDFSNWVIDQFKAKEDGQIQEIRQALIDRGLIK